MLAVDKSIYLGKDMIERVKHLSSIELSRLTRYAVNKREYDLMVAIAKAERTSEKDLERLAAVTRVDVQVAVANNPKSNRVALRIISKSPLWQSRLAAAKNIRTPEDRINKLLFDDVKEVRLAARDTLFKQEETVKH